jgi:ribosomal protein L7/L12
MVKIGQLFTAIGKYVSSVEVLPKAVLECAKKEVAENAKAKLEAAGAKVTLK